ncbi:heterokaryon incompatibility protein-domain-containing protein [Cercophora scortea]|uniref:Heterokaryon incompatibility protein-domain-containing protein n=1 Tax=Cercophora scortea TaxID=314031 RepID=A0AAE0IX84_9PEZI|nr:heterokaryon incompatibility protein-domain-containing protein [Cercophora scortea]
MSRWHADSCFSPDITIESDVVRCKACNSIPDLQSITNTHAAFPPVPLDEPYGQFNLRWPSTVPYVDLGLELSTKKKQSSPATEQPTTSIATIPSMLSVYPTRLNSDEFRLVCLSEGGADKTSLIHVDLEVYEDDQCPEYETVSYTWGGEDDDSSLCRPLYVGPYWDVLLQTKNCWDMLQFLRPLRGFRLMWVDAVCINQADTLERNSQVAKMARIYEKCRRVVAYLGSDIVAPTPGKYPPRRLLHKACDISLDGPLLMDGKVNFYRLLERKYFSRLWVVQELVLSPQISIQVGGLEFLIDAATAKALEMARTDPDDILIKSDGVRWGQTAAPWVEHVAQRGFRSTWSNDRDLLDVFKATAKSKSRDCRDEVFAVYGLIDKRSESSVLVPDYSLSTLHVFIGFFAHLLVTLKHTHILFDASGMSAWGSYPSWMPDWRREEKRWTVKTHGTLFRNLLSEARTPGLKYVGKLSKWCLAKHEEQVEDPESVRPRLYEVNDIPDPGPMVGDFFQQLVDMWEKPNEGKWSHYTEEATTNSWDRSVTIDTSTGALTSKLVHVCALAAVARRIDDAPSLQEGDKQSETFEIVAVGDKHARILLHTTSGVPLDQVIIPGQDHLFFFPNKLPMQSFRYLVMRKVQELGGGGDSLVFKLICLCSDVLFQVPVKKGDSWYEVKNGTKGTNVDQLFTPSSSNYDTLFDILESVKANLTHETEQEKEDAAFWMNVVFPGVESEDDTMPAIQGLLNDVRKSSPGFLDSYIECLGTKFQPSVHAAEGKDYVELRIPPGGGGWTPMTGPNFDVEESMGLIYKEWRYENDDRDATWSTDEDIVSMFARIRDTSREAIFIRAPVRDLDDFLWDSYRCRQLERLTRGFRLTSEDELSMFRRGPREEDREVPYPDWPNRLLKLFNIDGRSKRVTILCPYRNGRGGVINCPHRHYVRSANEIAVSGRQNIGGWYTRTEAEHQGADAWNQVSVSWTHCQDFLWAGIDNEAFCANYSPAATRVRVYSGLCHDCKDGHRVQITYSKGTKPTPDPSGDDDIGKRGRERWWDPIY